jgi:protein-tyrosine phosphatase
VLRSEEPATLSADEIDLEFESLFNVRDLGGHRTRDGAVVRERLLFRADAVHRATPADCERLAALGLRTVIDLRTTVELEARGRVAEHVADVWHHAPVLDEIWDPSTVRAVDDAVHEAAAYLTERYLDMLEGGADAFVQAFDVLAAPDALPALFHCAAGKDRTGVLAALVLGTLGVDDDTIADDYAASGQSVERSREWLAQHDPQVAEVMAQLPATFGMAPREAMVDFLHELEQRHGSIAGYLTRVGVPAAHLDVLRANLVTR